MLFSLLDWRIVFYEWPVIYHEDMIVSINLVDSLLKLKFCHRTPSVLGVSVFVHYRIISTVTVVLECSRIHYYSYARACVQRSVGVHILRFLTHSCPYILIACFSRGTHMLYVFKLIFCFISWCSYHVKYINEIW